MQQEKGNLSIHSENLFPIIKKWLYSDQDIFLRELVSNAVDAIHKRSRLMSLGELPSKPEAEKDEIHVTAYPSEKKLVISDNGIGMSAEEVRKYINQIAFSGAAEFMEKYQKGDGDSIIGHFGLGFYSAFMVSDLVEIETLSSSEGAAPVHWQCDGSSDYEMQEGSRAKVGTDIILHLNEDGEKYLDLFTLRGVLLKYCSFMPVPIYAKNGEEAPKEAGESKAPADAEPLNDTEPLYRKNPRDVSAEEYTAFYHKVFFDLKEPLFHIHLNMDYPYHLQGILYFPKLGNEFESAEGQVKLYANQVFVADNVKEIIPDYLLLLKGVIDCPDIPLNVSRSFLQNDIRVQKISEYITRKVAEKLSSLHKEEKEHYDAYWQDIHPFVKYGCLRNEKFYEKVKDALIYRSLKKEAFISLDEYLTDAKDRHENKVYYADDTRQLTRYIQLLLSQGDDVLELPSTIDIPFISFLESKQEGLRFIRVDAAFAEAAKDQEEVISEDDQKAAAETFQLLLEKEDLSIRLEAMKEENVTAVIELSEEDRRLEQMMKLYGQSGLMGMSASPKETLVLNQKNPLVRHLLAHPDSENAALYAKELYDLARISHAPLSAADLGAFISRSEEILTKLTGG